MVPATLALVVLSISLRTWITSEVTDNGGGPGGLTGDVQIGLWKACADMPCRNVIVAEGNDAQSTCSKPDIFSDLGDCRNGHCVGGEDLSIFTSWNNNDLCNRSAASSAFGIIAMFLIMYNFYLTTYKEIRRLDPGCGDGEYETAAWINFLAALSAVICWAIMNRWVTVMNDEKGTSRSKETDSLKFEDLKTGIGMSLMLISWLALFVNTIVCVICAKEQGVMARAKGSTPALVPEAEAESAPDGNYLDVTPADSLYEPMANGYEPPLASAREPPAREPPAPPNRRNSTSSDV